MEGFSAELQIVISLIAVGAAVLGFAMGHKVEFVNNENNKGAPAALCFIGAFAGAISVIGLVSMGTPIICGGLFVSCLVIGVGLGFMTARRGQ